MIPRTLFPILALLLSLTPLGAGAQQARLEMAELMKLLVAKGYHDIREVTLTEDRFEVDALDDSAQRVRLVVDARNGELLSQERQ